MSLGNEQESGVQKLVGNSALQEEQEEAFKDIKMGDESRQQEEDKDEVAATVNDENTEDEEDKTLATQQEEELAREAGAAGEERVGRSCQRGA